MSTHGDARFSPDGLHILSAGYGNIGKVWDATTGKLLINMEGKIKGVSSASLSPDGSRVLTVSDEGTATVWDASTGEPPVNNRVEIYNVRSAEFSPDGMRILTKDKDGKIKIYAATIDELFEIGCSLLRFQHGFDDAKVYCKSEKNRAKKVNED